MSLLEEYAANGLPVEVSLEWSLKTIRHAIGKGNHFSTLSLESTAFYRKEILERTQKGFSIVFSVTKAITLFGTDLRISRLTSVDQVNHKPHLICNSSEEPDASTPLVNASTYKGKPPKAM